MVQTGGTNTILSYELQVYGPTDSNWTSLIGGNQNFNTQLTFLQVGLTTGVNYQYRVRASNVYGWGPFSDPATIVADSAPAQLSPVTITAENVNVRISWNLPSTTNGSPILKYKVDILQSNGQTYSQSLTCNGSNPDIVSSQTPSCLVKFTELRAAPFLLTQGTLVQATV